MIRMTDVYDPDGKWRNNGKARFVNRVTWTLWLQSDAVEEPTLRYERKFWKENPCGRWRQDYAGRGRSNGGPVVAAAVLFAPEVFNKGVGDSGAGAAEKREKAHPLDHGTRADCWVGSAGIDEIDSLNITGRLYVASQTRARGADPHAICALSTGERFLGPVAKPKSSAAIARASASRPPRSSPRSPL